MKVMKTTHRAQLMFITIIPTYAQISSVQINIKTLKMFTLHICAYVGIIININ